MKKIKWGNVLKVVVLMICMGVIVHDLYFVFIIGSGFTWFGLGTHFITWCVAGCLFSDLKEQYESIG